MSYLLSSSSLLLLGDLLQESKCGDARSDESDVVREMGSGYTSCSPECSVETNPILPWLHATRCSGITLVHFKRSLVVL